MKRFVAGIIVFLVFCALDECPEARSQSPCRVGARQSVGRRWDAVLGRSWEITRDCSHPDWPGRVGAINMVLRAASSSDPSEAVKPQPEIVMHAGDTVTLWRQSAMVRILTSGIAERSARAGENVIVRVTRADEAGGLRIERINGIVRGPNQVEMER